MPQRSAPLRRDTGEARLEVPVLKERTCPPRKAGCGESFRPSRTMQTHCSPRCAQAFAAWTRRKDDVQKAREARADRARTKARLLDLKPLAWWEKRAERVVNEYVRLRDAHLGCVSCDKPASWGGQWHCSHFRSVGAASTVRYHLWNLHKACSECNHHKSGNLFEYEPRLRAKIGDAKVDWLRTQNHVVRRDRAYLARLHDVFARKCRRLVRRARA